VVIDGAAELLAPLRALSPEMDTFGRMPLTGVTEIHMDPPGPAPAVSDHTVLAEVTEETIAALLAEVGPGTTTSLLFAELRHLGGAVGRPAADAGALSHLAGEYAVFCVAIAPVPEAVAAGLVDARKVIAALEPWTSGTRVLNFSEATTDAATAFTPEVLERLLRIRAEVDPQGVFLASHPV
jgi:hypothetical protein